MYHGKGVILVVDEKGLTHHFSKFLMDPVSGLAYDEPAPTTSPLTRPMEHAQPVRVLGLLLRLLESL